MSKFSWEVDKVVTQTLGSHERILDPIEAHRILIAARAHFNLPPISIVLLERNRRSYIAQAKQKGTTRTIHQTPQGMTPSSILHEIAHHFSGAFNHGAKWVWAYYRLTSWFLAVDVNGAFSLTQDELDEFV